MYYAYYNCKVYNEIMVKSTNQILQCIYEPSKIFQQLLFNSLVQTLVAVIILNVPFSH